MWYLFDKDMGLMGEIISLYIFSNAGHSIYTVTYETPAGNTISQNINEFEIYFEKHHIVISSL